MNHSKINKKDLLFKIIPVLLGAFYYFNDIELYKSANLANALRAVITFTSIVISIYGILITNIININNGSKEDTFAEKFLFYINGEYLSKRIQESISSGILLVLLSIVMFFIDLITISFYKKFITSIWIIFIFKFSLTTWRMISTLLKVLLNPNRKCNVKQQISQTEKQELREKYKAK